MTNLHVALQTQADMVSFYGPSVITQFGEWPAPDSYTVEHFFGVVAGVDPVGRIEPSEQWTQDKSADWVAREDVGYEREYRDNPGYQWLREGVCEGRLLGGCITSLMNSRGTRYHPSFDGALLLLETPEGASDFTTGRSLAHVEASLANLRNDGVYERICGLVFGRGFGYSDEQHETLKQLILQATRGYDFPIVYGVDVGHSDPFATIPLGVKGRLASSEDEFSILESGVR